MPDAPAALRRGRRPQTVVGIDDRVDRDHARVGERDHRRRSRGPAGAPASSASRARGRVHHQVLAARGGEDCAASIVSIGGELVALAPVARRVRDEHGLGGEDVADRPEAVHRERRAGRDEVDDGLGEAEPRRHLDRAGDRDDVDRDAALGEEAAASSAGGPSRPAGRRGPRRPGRASRRDRDREPAAAVAERPDDGSSAPVSRQEIEAGDAEIRDAVADELDDVVGPDEEDVEVEVLDPRDEAPVVLLEDQAGIVEERERRLDEAALVRDRRGGGGPSSLGPAGTGSFRLRLARSSASGSRPRRGCSHEAMRVIVAVLAPVCREISA